MSDSEKLAAVPPKKRRRIRRIVLFAFTVFLVCAGILLFVFREELTSDNMRRWFKYLNVKDDGSYGVFAFDSHNSNAYAALGDGLAVASVGGVDTFDEYGREVSTSRAGMYLPVIESAEQVALTYDVGGTVLIVTHEEDGELLRIEDNQTILDADLAGDGSFCYSSSSGGYKSILTVYDSQQKLLYRWLSSTMYLPTCAVSSGADRLAAIALNQVDGQYRSQLYLFRTDSEQIDQIVDLSEQLIYDLYFVNQTTICSIGENAAYFLDTDGRLLGTYSYGDTYLKDFSDEGNGFLTLSLNKYKAGNRYSVITVDPAGREIASVYIGQEILDLSVCDEYVAILTTDQLFVFDKQLNLYYETQQIGTATSVVMREDGTVLLLGSGQGELYIP